MPKHDENWKKATSEAQRKRWAAYRDSAPDSPERVNLKAARKKLSYEDVATVVDFMSVKDGPTVSESAALLGVRSATLTKYLREYLGVDDASRMIRERQADSMRGNQRGKGAAKSEKFLSVVKDRWGPKNPNWKGSEAGIDAMHTRLHRRRGKAFGCTRCGTKDRRKRYDWANLTGNYADPSDYASMCRKCHIAFDSERRITDR